MNKLSLLSVGIITLTLAGVALVALPKKNLQPEVFLLSSELSHAEVKEQYDQWKLKYQQSHSATLLGDSESAETYRISNFKDNLIKISDHNQKYLNGEHSFTMKLNQFSHLTTEEFEEMHLSDLSHDNEEIAPKKYLEQSFDAPESYSPIPEPAVLISNQTIPFWKQIWDMYVDAFKSLFSQSAESERPLEVDWRSKTGIPLEQGGCGSCYTFATTAAIQAILGTDRRLSTQELVDCDSRNKGCKGGIPQKVYSYVTYLGLTYEDNYPYITRQRSGCGINYEDTENRVTISTYYDVKANPDSLETALKYAPVSAAIDAKSLQLYGSGIYDYPCSTLRSESNHAVLIVGYTSEYFLVRNSWGHYWGENGYFKIKKETNSHGPCGIYNDMSYPYIKK